MQRIKFLIITFLMNTITFLYKRIVESWKGQLFCIKYKKLINKIENTIRQSSDEKYNVLSKADRQALNNCIKISFTGDLILLRDAIERAQNGEIYDFKKMLEYASPYWKNADLSIGVFEGPMAGKDVGYSFSNYADSYQLSLNFPEEFAKDVQDAGINFVTIATNHLLDKGIDGYKKTISKLIELNFNYTGAYLNLEEYNHIKIVEIKGIRIAILAYTYGINGYNPNFFFLKENKHITKLLVSPKSKYYKQCLSIVKHDFAEAKRKNVDMILVLPHMGEQFLHKPDFFQKHWCDIFVSLGADIILSDHTHSVQPIEWKKKDDGRNVLIAYCPGNFMNTYTDFNGDASIIANVYIDKNTHQVAYSSIVPLFAHCTQERGWYSLPIFRAMSDISIFNKLSIYDQRRLSEVHKLTTKVALNKELDLDNVQYEYFIHPNKGYLRTPVSPIDLEDDAYKESALLNEIQKANSICFVGDGITEGSQNGGYGWYEPITEALQGKKIFSFTKSNQTSNFFKEKKTTFSNFKCDLYILALGCNDIRFRDANKCAMTPKAFVTNYAEIVNNIKSSNINSSIIAIAPWRSMQYDPHCRINLQEKSQIYKAYFDSLEHFCQNNSILFINPNDYIMEAIANTHNVAGGYLKDEIHPTAFAGIQLFAKACMIVSHNKLL